MRLDHLIYVQTKLANRIKVRSLKRKINYIGGVDVAITRDSLVGCIGVFEFPGLKLVDSAWSRAPVEFPYIPGFLSFREIPVLLKCWNRIKRKPDLILVDGQGIAHPRSLGLATHLGILLNRPTIGCAKSHLYGEYRIPGEKKGSYALMKKGEKKLGLVLRTRDRVNPLFVSPGHLVDFNDCRKYVLATAVKYRIPEPIRFAHKTAGEKARQLNV